MKYKPTKEQVRKYNATAYAKADKKVRADRNRLWYDLHPTRAIFNKRRSEAKRKGIPFTIRFDDIVWPEYCPALGIKLDYSRKGMPIDASPSIDKIVPASGYIPGNVAVISCRANRIKHNASMQEIADILIWMDRNPGVSI